MSRSFLIIACLAITLVSAAGLDHVFRHDDMGYVGLDRVDDHHDQRVLLQQLRSEGSPITKWFVSDWPLYNGFYRPLPTVSFAIDDAIFHSDLNKYKIQNWLIAFASSLVLLWLVWELFYDRALAAGSAIVFAAWQNGLENWLPLYWLLLSLGLLIAIYGLAFGASRRLWWLVCAGAVIFLGRELSLVLQSSDINQRSFDFRVVGWPVGRTATLMTLFSLSSLFAFCKYERLRRPQWAILSIALLAMAIGSYEQVVVVPALLLACAIALRLQSVSVRWVWHVIPWVMIATYIWLHQAFLEVDSRYRGQAMRGIRGGIRDIIGWIFPARRDLPMLAQVFEQYIGIYALAMELYWKALVDFLANVCGLIVARRRLLQASFGLLCAVGSYAPMSFQHTLGHYFHLPLAFRAIFVVALLLATFELLLSLHRSRNETRTTAA